MRVLAERPTGGVTPAPQPLATGFAFCLLGTEVPMILGYPKPVPMSLGCPGNVIAKEQGPD